MKTGIKYRRLILFFNAVLLFTIQSSVMGQFGLKAQNPDSLRMVELYDQSRTLFGQDLKFEAKKSAEDALQFAMLLDKPLYEIHILELIGDIYSSGGEHANSIPYYLRTANLLESRNDTVRVIRLYEKIAIAYRKEKVYEKELDYYGKAYRMLAEKNADERARFKELMAIAAFNSNKMDWAEELFIEIIAQTPVEGKSWLRSKQYLIKIFDATGEYDSALRFCQDLLLVYENRGEVSQVFIFHNNIGYYQTLLDNYRSASQAYIAAISLGSEAEIDSDEIALMMVNAGVCFQNMEDRKRAIYYFNQAIQLLNENHAEKSRVENMLATIYFEERDLYNAGHFSIMAIESAKKSGDPLRKSEAYFTYSQVLKEGNDPIYALENYEKYLMIRDSLSMERKIAEQELENRKIILEKEAQDLKLRFKENEVSELAISQLILQNERVKQEKELLMNEKDLQVLEQERMQQDMVIAVQKYEAAKQERENQALEQENLFNENIRELDAQKLLDEEQRNEILKQQQEIDQNKLENQEKTRKALILILLGGFVIVIIILWFLISTRRKKKLLAQQKTEIEEKNVDLEQKNEEISTQRDEIEAQRNLVFDQKEAIETYNMEVRKSIEYAKRIQSSTLPDLVTMQENVSDSFVLFRPRDVVSGDFYWYANVEGKSVFVVADSTGHGVPGAFMSMLGLTMLKELVQKEYLTHPGVILRRLRKDIINTMGQKGASGEQRDGYDMALITINHEENILEYAGAYNPLYLIREKSNPPPVITDANAEVNMSLGNYYLYEVIADKMPIAHYDRMDKFVTHEFKVFKGDMLYMFTDGYADQFGGEKDKKFMYKPFKELLLTNAEYPMDVQHQKLSETLDEWMGTQIQIDDICVMGLRI